MGGLGNISLLEADFQILLVKSLDLWETRGSRTRRECFGEDEKWKVRKSCSFQNQLQSYVSISDSMSNYNWGYVCSSPFLWKRNIWNYSVLKYHATNKIGFCAHLNSYIKWPQDWKKSLFIPIPKKGNPKEYSNYCTIALISHASKVMLNILQARLQQYMNWELPDVQAGFRKGRGTRNQIANIHWIIKKAREFQKNIYFCFID